MGKCPTGALKVVEREADEFDKEAVDQYLSGREDGRGKMAASLPRGCPSSTIQAFEPFAPSREAPRTDTIGENGR
ncbi:MAG: 4Fe-4S ferredoxin, partial [Deltaproteobacteria bacterium]|nr:4Fe-4S ferredoxin [Deltaproteobacteria bacterium]